MVVVLVLAVIVGVVVIVVVVVVIVVVIVVWRSYRSGIATAAAVAISLRRDRLVHGLGGVRCYAAVAVMSSLVIVVCCLGRPVLPEGALDGEVA